MIKHGIPKDHNNENTTDEILRIRAMEDSLEKHERMVLLNPDDYNSWNYLKRHFLNGTNEDFMKQMELTQMAIQENPKSYHTWFHRFLFFQKINTDALEQKLCSLLLKLDPRNFHCWNYCLKNGFKMERDLHNFTSMHYSDFDQNMLFLDPNDEGMWRVFEKRHKLIGRIRKYQNTAEILLEEPFKGIFSVDGKTIQIKYPTRRILLTENEELKNMQLSNINIKVTRESQPEIIQEILDLDSKCIHALKYKMIYSQNDSERTEILGILKKEDPLRSVYYERLYNDKYEKFLLE